MASATVAPITPSISLPPPPLVHQHQPTRVTANSALGQVLQSEPVRRLFNQPNIVIHAIPRTNSPTAFRMVRPTTNDITDHPDKNTDSLPDLVTDEAQPKSSSTPELSIRVTDGSDSENLLPAKGSGKSEILLVPVKRQRKECGHFEPCESLVCCVQIELGEDDEALVPCIIEEEDEIDAPVSRHCTRPRCDALSIDHDCCRAAAVRLRRCDRSSLCDVCDTGFTDETARLEHKRCRRKGPAYQHYPASPSDVFRYRMRQRELQMIEAAKAKRTSDYLDPVTGFARTIEALSRNDELIIIPKMPPFPPKIVKPCYAPLASSVSHYNGYSPTGLFNKLDFQGAFGNYPGHNNIIRNNYNGNSNHINNNINNNNNSKNNNLKNANKNRRAASTNNKELTSEMISDIIASCQKSINRESQADKNNFIPSKQIKLSDHGSLNGATVNIMNVPTTQSQPSISLTGLTNNNINVSSGSKSPAFNLLENITSNSIKISSISPQPCMHATGLKSTVAEPATAPQQQQQQFIVNANLQLTSANNAELPHTSSKAADLPRKKFIKILPKESYKLVPIMNLKKSLHRLGLPKYYVVPNVPTTISENAATPKKKKKRKIKQKEDQSQQENKNESLKDQVNDQEQGNSKGDDPKTVNKFNTTKEETKSATTTTLLSKLPEIVIPATISSDKMIDTISNLSLSKSLNNSATDTNITSSIDTSIVSNSASNSSIISSSPENSVNVNGSPESSINVSVVSGSPESIVGTNVDNSNSGGFLRKQKGRRKRLKKLTKRFKFECKYCSKRFTTSIYLRVHVAEHENNPEFLCRLCERGFTTKQNMRKHEELTHKSDEQRCEVCNTVLPSTRELAEHARRQTHPRSCTECPEIFISCNHLDFHQRSMHGFLICNICKRQVASSRAKRHLMLEHALPKHRVETGLAKLTTQPSEDEQVREQEVVLKPSLPTITVPAGKTQLTDSTRRSSSRRRSSKEFFVCTVCERRFDSEKQYHIHQALFPKKFTPCPDCGRKFHRKTEYTEHSKTCNPDKLANKGPTSRKRKSNLISNEFILKSDNLCQNSIDQKQNELLETNACKELNNKVCVQSDNREDKKEELDNFEESGEVGIETDENVKTNYEDKKSENGDKIEDVVENKSEEIIEYDYNSELIIENTNVNGLMLNSNDCLGMLNVEKSENNDVEKGDYKEILLLNNKKSQENLDKTTVFDKASALSSIIQDHNYQVLQ